MNIPSRSCGLYIQRYPSAMTITSVILDNPQSDRFTALTKVKKAIKIKNKK
jgi:hypothetical protein